MPLHKEYCPLNVGLVAFLRQEIHTDTPKNNFLNYSEATLLKGRGKTGKWRGFNKDPHPRHSPQLQQPPHMRSLFTNSA